MQRVKDCISLLVLILTCGITLSAVARVLQQDLPGEMAEPTDVLYWLTERDLAGESPDSRARLVQRVDAELAGDRDWQKELKNLDDARRQRLDANLPQLLELWFIAKADQYAALPEADRETMVDGMLEHATRWIGKVLPAKGKSDSQLPTLMAGMAVIGPQISDWIQQADPAKQPQMTQLQLALQNRLIQREMEKALSGKRPKK